MKRNPEQDTPHNARTTVTLHYHSLVILIFDQVTTVYTKKKEFTQEYLIYKVDCSGSYSFARSQAESMHFFLQHLQKSLRFKETN